MKFRCVIRKIIKLAYKMLLFSISNGDIKMSSYTMIIISLYTVRLLNNILHNFFPFWTTKILIHVRQITWMNENEYEKIPYKLCMKMFHLSQVCFANFIFILSHSFSYSFPILTYGFTCFFSLAWFFFLSVYCDIKSWIRDLLRGKCVFQNRTKWKHTDK